MIRVWYLKSNWRLGHSVRIPSSAKKDETRSCFSGCVLCRGGTSSSSLPESRFFADPSVAMLQSSSGTRSCRCSERFLRLDGPGVQAEHFLRPSYHGSRRHGLLQLHHRTRAQSTHPLGSKHAGVPRIHGVYVFQLGPRCLPLFEHSRRHSDNSTYPSVSNFFLNESFSK